MKKWFVVIVIAVAFAGEIGQNFWTNFQQADKKGQQAIEKALADFRASSDYKARRATADERIAGFARLKNTLDRQSNAALSERGATIRVFDGRIHEADKAIASINAEFDAWAQPQEQRIVEQLSRMSDRAGSDNFLGIISSVSIGAIMAVLSIGLAFASSEQDKYGDARTLFILSLLAQFASCMITQMGVELKTGYTALSYVYSLAYLVGVPAYIHWQAHHITGFYGVSIFNRRDAAVVITANQDTVTVETEVRQELPDDVETLYRIANHCHEQGLETTFDNLAVAAQELGIQWSRPKIYRTYRTRKTFPLGNGKLLKDVIEG